jgi:hypothetical protein
LRDAEGFAHLRHGRLELLRRRRIDPEGPDRVVAEAPGQEFELRSGDGCPRGIAVPAGGVAQHPGGVEPRAAHGVADAPEVALGRILGATGGSEGQGEEGATFHARRSAMPHLVRQQSRRHQM